MNRLKQLRNEKKIKQSTLSEEFHIARSVISDWENGKSEPSVKMAEKLAEYFGVSFSYFWGVSDIREETKISALQARILEIMDGLPEEAQAEIERFARFQLAQEQSGEQQ